MKKGFSIIVLTVTIVVVLIITTTATIGVVNYQSKVNKMEFAIELARVQTKVDIFYQNNNQYPIKASEEIATIDISNVPEDLKSQFLGETIDNNIVVLNYINMNLIFDNRNSNTDELHSLKYGNQLRSTKDVYLVSTETGKVYYLDSYKGYYTLTDELKDLIEYSYNLSPSSSFGIVFSKSTEKYTNSPIISEVKVLSKYEVQECKLITSSGLVVGLTLDRTEDDYNIYVTPNNIDEKYDIILKCKEIGSEDIVSTYYSVNNFDKESPKLEIIGDKNTITNNVTGDTKCMYFIEYSDDESGIDTIKYAEFKVVAEDETSDEENLEVIRKYFETNGKNVIGNKIEFSQGIRWLTIYIKDKAGNERYIYKQVPTIEKTASNEYNSLDGIISEEDSSL